MCNTNAIFVVKERVCTMKKILSLAIIFNLIICMLTLCACGENSKNLTGLRDITWGMDRTALLKAEKADYAGADESYVRFYDEDISQPLVFWGVSSNNMVDLLYYFNSEDKLFKIQYRLVAALNDVSYKEIKNMMSEIYGSPYLEDEKNAEDDNIIKTSWKYKKSDISLEFDYNKNKDRNTMYVVFLPNT